MKVPNFSFSSAPKAIKSNTLPHHAPEFKGMPIHAQISHFENMIRGTNSHINLKQGQLRQAGKEGDKTRLRHEISNLKTDKESYSESIKALKRDNKALIKEEKKNAMLPPDQRSMRPSNIVPKQYEKIIDSEGHVAGMKELPRDPHSIILDHDFNPSPGAPKGYTQGTYTPPSQTRPPTFTRPLEGMQVEPFQLPADHPLAGTPDPRQRPVFTDFQSMGFQSSPLPSNHPIRDRLGLTTNTPPPETIAPQRIIHSNQGILKFEDIPPVGRAIPGGQPLVPGGKLLPIAPHDEKTFENMGFKSSPLPGKTPSLLSRMMGRQPEASTSGGASTGAAGATQPTLSAFDRLAAQEQRFGTDSPLPPPPNIGKRFE